MHKPVGMHYRIELSPDGRFRIEYAENEGRMSHWVSTPAVFDTTRDEMIFALGGFPWHGEEAWEADGRFTLVISQYPHGGYGLPLHFDADAMTVRIATDPQRHPIEQAQRLVEWHFQRRARLAPPPAPPPPRKADPKQVVLGLALGLLLIAMAAMGAYLWQQARETAPAPYSVAPLPKTIDF